AYVKKTNTKARTGTALPDRNPRFRSVSAFRQAPFHSDISGLDCLFFRDAVALIYVRARMGLDDEVTELSLEAKKQLLFEFRLQPLLHLARHEGADVAAHRDRLLD